MCNNEAKEHAYMLAESAACAAVEMAGAIRSRVFDLHEGIKVLDTLRERALELSEGEGDAPIAAHLAQRVVEILANGGDSDVIDHYLSRARLLAGSMR